MSEVVTREYDPNDFDTWAQYCSGGGTRVYIQTPPEDVDTDVTDTFLDEEVSNFTVEAFSWGEVQFYEEGLDPDGNDASVQMSCDTDTVDGFAPQWWIEAELLDQGYIEVDEEVDGEVEQEAQELLDEMDEQQYAAQEAVFPGQTEAATMSIETVNTDGVVGSESVKELAWEAYKQAWNEVDSMDSMTKLETRTAREKFNNWWEMNHE